jgi:hypothetical protein
VGSAKIGDAKGKISANAEEGLDGDQRASDTQMPEAGVFSRTKRRTCTDNRRNEGLPWAGR